MTDRPEITRPQSNVPGLNINDINDLVLSLHGTTVKRDESADFYQRIGLRSPESLLGLVSTEEKAKKYSIPKRLVQAVIDIDDYDPKKRERATQVLKTASLKELVDIRDKAENLSRGRKIIFNDLIRAKAEEAWKECGGDPRKLGRVARDPRVAEALILCAPDELRNCRDTYDEFRKFMYSSTPHTVRDYEKALDKLERIATFSKLVERAAADDDAGKEVKDIAAEHKKLSIWHHAKAFAMEFHGRLSNADPDLVSDGVDLSKDVREDDGKEARRIYLELVDNKKFDLRETVFWRHTRQFLHDKTIDDNLYVETVRKLGDKAIADAPYDDTPFTNAGALFMLLGRSGEGMSKTKQKELDKQFERVSTVLEDRLAEIKEPDDLLRHQKALIESYLRCTERNASLDKAKALYALARKTIERLPEKERKKELKDLDDLLYDFGKRVREK